MARWLAGHVLFAIGLVWLIVDRILLAVVPGRWGGPNIGGGFLLLLAYAAIGGGLAILVGALRFRRGRSNPAVTLCAVSLQCALVAGVVGTRIGISAPPGPFENGRWVSRSMRPVHRSCFSSLSGVSRGGQRRRTPIAEASPMRSSPNSRRRRPSPGRRAWTSSIRGVVGTAGQRCFPIEQTRRCC